MSIIRKAVSWLKVRNTVYRGNVGTLGLSLWVVAAATWLTARLSDNTATIVGVVGTGFVLSLVYFVRGIHTRQVVVRDRGTTTLVVTAFIQKGLPVAEAKGLAEQAVAYIDDTTAGLDDTVKALLDPTSNKSKRFFATYDRELRIAGRIKK